MDNFDLILDGCSLEERVDAFHRCFAVIDEEDGSTLASIASCTKDLEVFEECIEKIKSLEHTGFLLGGCSFNVEEKWLPLLYEALESEQDFGDFACCCPDFNFAKKALDKVQNKRILKEVSMDNVELDEIAALALERLA